MNVRSTRSAEISFQSQGPSHLNRLLFFSEPNGIIKRDVSNLNIKSSERDDKTSSYLQSVHVMSLSEAF